MGRDILWHGNFRRVKTGVGFDEGRKRKELSLAWDLKIGFQKCVQSCYSCWKYNSRLANC